MLGRRGTFVAALLVAHAALAAFAVGCKRSSSSSGEGVDAAPATAPIAPTVAGQPPSAATEGAPTAANAYDPFAPNANAVPDAEPPSDNVDLPTGEIVTPGKPGAPVTAAPVDPFDAAIAATRASALPCFAPLPSAEYAATLVVVVTPSGRVTRVDLEPGNVEDASVLSCLRAAAQDRTFPTSGGRTVRIEVRVTPK